MKKSLLLIALMLLVAVPAMAARVSSVPITHDEALVYQAYPGNSEGTDLEFLGYLGTGEDVITAVPGVLSIVPGENWANFVGAAQETPAIAYTIKNVVLCKQTPSIIQCADVFPAKKICQQGTPNIRLWWPLMYEVPEPSGRSPSCTEPAFPTTMTAQAARTPPATSTLKYGHGR